MNRSIVLALLILGAVACQPEPFKSIGERYDLITGIEGTWEISRVDVIDLSLPVPEEREISDFFVTMNGAMTITFNSETSAYTVTNGGLANPFGDGGTYAFNQEDYPDQLSFTDSGSNTVDMRLLNMVRASDATFGVQWDREACDKNYVAYKYTFKRIL